MMTDTSNYASLADRVMHRSQSVVAHLSRTCTRGHYSKYSLTGHSELARPACPGFLFFLNNSLAIKIKVSIYLFILFIYLLSAIKLRIKTS